MTTKLTSKKIPQLIATSVPTNEPPIPRRKKNPELAYRSHEFIGGFDQHDGPVPTTRAARVSLLINLVPN